jgi:hypothetical protein
MTTTATPEARPTRAEISRQNSRRSTGPRRPESKEKVKFNALKHGLRAKTMVLPGEDKAAYQARLDAWTAELQPQGEAERLLVARAVHASWQLERVDRARAARRDADRYADADRLAAQAEEVVALGRRLFWDPVGPLCLYPHPAPADGEPRRVSDSGLPDDLDDPARIVVQLEASALGCAWLLERWGELRDLLEHDLTWLPPDRLRAVRLLGRQPLDAVDDLKVMAVYLGCWALEPAGAPAFSDLIGELAPKERAVYLERLNARVPPFGHPEDPEAARAALLALVAAEEGRLEEILAGHLERAEAEARAEAAFDGGAWAERLRRYEQSNDRLLLRTLETLRKRKGADGAAPARGPAAARPDSEDSPVVCIAPRAVEATPEGLESPAGPEAPPEAIETPGDDAAVPVGSEPGGCGAGPAEAAPPEAAGEDEPGADGLTEEEIEARIRHVAELFGLGPAAPAAEVGDEAAEEPGPTPDGTGPCPAADPGRGPAGPTEVAAIGGEVPVSSERGPRPPAAAFDRPSATARRVAGAVLALFAPLVFAGLPAAAARSSLGPPTDQARPMGRSPARGPIRAAMSADWLCSSRAPDAAISCGDARETSPRRGVADGCGDAEEIGSRSAERPACAVAAGRDARHRGGEFGRTPHGQNSDGRDHNNKGFSLWLAGGGVRPGLVYGRTDDFGYEAVEDPMHVQELHATILHLLGLDHERLTYRYPGRDMRLTDVKGVVHRGILA